MLREMDSRLLNHWMAYATLEPFGPHQEDLRAGYVASAAVNPWRKKDTEPVGPADFFPHLADEEPTVEESGDDPETTKLRLMLWTSRLGGRIETGNSDGGTR